MVFFFELDAKSFEKRNDIFIAENGQSAVEEPSIPWYMLNDFIYGKAVGHIAAAAPRDGEFPPKLVPFIDEEDPGALFPCRNCRHQS